MEDQLVTSNLARLNSLIAQDNKRMENNRVLDKVKFLSESRGEESLNYFKFRKLLPFKHNDTCFTSHSKRLDRSQKLVAMIRNVDFGYLSFFYEIL